MLVASTGEAFVRGCFCWRLECARKSLEGDSALAEGFRAIGLLRASRLVLCLRWRLILARKVGWGSPRGNWYFMKTDSH
ncbi:hypothetical protein KCU87_g166, partial [Aureobasidium melanogenum]